MKTLIIKRCQERLPRRFLSDVGTRLHRQLRCRAILQSRRPTLTLVFVDPREMKKLNSSYRQKTYATDVLSFAPIDEGSLGELVICPAVLRRQAKAHSLTFQQELAFVYIHGVLHLLGYDHESDRRQAMKMYRLQDQLFEDLFYPVTVDTTYQD